MDDQIENIENISNNFDSMGEKMFFMNQKISSFKSSNNLKINFEGCHVAISRNGGLIGVCKKRSFLDTQKDSKVNKNILVFQQNMENFKLIPITWNYNQRWIIAIDFLNNEKLFGICNDGVIYQFDHLLLKAKEKPTSQVFKQEQIYKAKFIDKGFIALTVTGTFYYVKDISNITPISIFQIKSLLEFSLDVDFIGIPSYASKSGKFELLFTNEKGNGVIHVTEQPKGYIHTLLPIETENGTDLTINGIFLLENKKLETYIKKIDENLIQKDENNVEKIQKNTKNGSVGKIISLAISPSYSNFALLNNDGTAYIFSTQVDDKEEEKRKEIKFKVSPDLSESDENEQKSLIKFGNKNYQFLFCGEDSLAISGEKYILLASIYKETLSYKINGGNSKLKLSVNSKCIQEIDGIRFITNEGIFLISKVCNEVYKICYPFSKDSGKKLLIAYKSDLCKEADCDKEIRDIMKDMPNAIITLAIAAANLFWVETDSDNNFKDIQLYMLKAAQLGKCFVNSEEFNFDKFVDICKNIRIINDLRNNKECPLFMTYKEYESLDINDLIKKILGLHNYKLAFRICKYLEYDVKKVYQKWACCKINKLDDIATKEDQNKLYDQIIDVLNDIKNISYIKLAKTAFKCKQNELGMKFLEKEKSILAKIPQYINHKKYNKALELASETYDSEIISRTLNEILDFNEIDDIFIEKIRNVKNIEFNIIDYLKKNKKEEYIENYYEANGNFEELMHKELEFFFTSNKLSEKKKHLKRAKEYQKKIDKNNINNKFYLTYLTELEKSIEFKKGCVDIEKNIIKKNNIEYFDNSIYDCYKAGVKANQNKYIEQQNKNFELNSKKMAIMKIRAMAEKGDILLVDKMVKESSLKKLNLTPLNLAELFIEYKKYDLAVEYIKQMNNSYYFDYKIQMLMHIGKYEDALDVIIGSKNMDQIPNLVNDILAKKPDLQNKVTELCKQYRVNLN